MDKDITIFDIAYRAGVSISTVSRVLNNKGKVKPATRSRVEQVVKELNYRPNIIAKNLSTIHSDVIGMIVPDVRNPFYANVFVECEKYANERGYILLLSNSMGSEQLELKHYDKLLAQRVSAIIHLGGNADRVVPNPKFLTYISSITSRIPIITAEELPDAKCYCVKIDYKSAMEKAMEYLLSLGHKNIALVGGGKDVLSTYQRQTYYRNILAANGLKYGDYYVANSKTYDVQGGYLAMREIFKKNELPTAIIAINDFSAVGIIKAIREKGLEIGEDISIVSFDNSYISELMEPELTSVGADYYELSKTIIDLATSLITNKKMEEVVPVPVHLSIRDSVTNIN